MQTQTYRCGDHPPPQPGWEEGDKKPEDEKKKPEDNQGGEHPKDAA